MERRDYYEILGVERGADGSTIKTAYRQLAMRYHPDRNPDDPEAEDHFKEATEAYTILSDEEQRRRYDRFGHAAFESRSGGVSEADIGSVAEVLEGLFGDLFGRRGRRARGRDLTYELDVEFTEAALGADKSIEIERPMPCSSCEGSGGAPGAAKQTCRACKGRGAVRAQRGLLGGTRPCTACRGRGEVSDTPCPDCSGVGSVRRKETLSVKIPAGVEDGATRSVSGGGEIAAGGRGDLHITLHVKPHPIFEREGADILCTVPVSFPEAVLGAALEVPTLAGKVRMKLPPGSQSGRVFRLRGKGISAYGGYGKGDQLVTVMVEIPEKVNKKQRQLIAELAQEMGTETMPQRKGFLDKLKSLFD
jgi:molecular chaperone DnaJ